ncbi:hypothetical protein HK096_003106, partial [Nowakowskiella sp. JEL0078]
MSTSDNENPPKLTPPNNISPKAHTVYYGPQFNQNSFSPYGFVTSNFNASFGGIESQ